LAKAQLYFEEIEGQMIRNVD